MAAIQDDDARADVRVCSVCQSDNVRHAHSLLLIACGDVSISGGIADDAMPGKIEDGCLCSAAPEELFHHLLEPVAVDSSPVAAQQELNVEIRRTIFIQAKARFHRFRIVDTTAQCIGAVVVVIDPDDERLVHDTPPRACLFGLAEVSSYIVPRALMVLIISMLLKRSVDEMFKSQLAFKTSAVIIFS
jgi:hypothetical protein